MASIAEFNIISCDSSGQPRVAAPVCSPKVARVSPTTGLIPWASPGRNALSPRRKFDGRSLFRPNPVVAGDPPPAAVIPPGEVTPTNADATRKRRRSFLRAIDDKDDARERDIRAKKAARRPDPHQRFVDILWGSRSVDLRARC